jgi:transcriptional regulator with XRE-family HTH domain
MEHRVNEELSGLITQVTNEIDWLMRENQISRADLAARMGVSPGRVSQVLSGGENLTLRTLAALGAALDAQFELELRPAAAVADGYGATHAVAATAGPAPRARPLRARGPLRRVFAPQLSAQTPPARTARRFTLRLCARAQCRTVRCEAVSLPDRRTVSCCYPSAAR